MSGINCGDAKEEIDVATNTPKTQGGDEPKNLNLKEDFSMPSPKQEEEVIKKKYGGLLPKKNPLISKDHERAFFDSADWALGKQGGAQKSKGPLEALRPKLQPTHQIQGRSRRSAYAPAEEGEVDDTNNTNGAASEDTKCDDAAISDEQSAHN